MDSLGEPGEIITFYSYKGGTGRSMALANVACILAKGPAAARVLMIDWDLEAPGLHRFFGRLLSHHFGSQDLARRGLDEAPGLIDLLVQLDSARGGAERASDADSE